MAKIQDIVTPQLQFTEGVAPDTPASGVVRIYAKDDGLLYSKDDAGTETLLSSGATTGLLDETAHDLLDHTGITGCGGTGGGAFTDLTDAIASYAGLGGKLIGIKSDTTGLEAVDAPSLSLPLTTQGDILIQGASSPARLGIGTAGQILAVNAGATAPEWKTVGTSPLTTKGDVFVYGSADARLPVGTNGQVLTADSTQALGVKWAAASGGGVPPERVYVPISADEGFDDEFNDGAIAAAWAAVDVAGKANTWYEISGIKGLSVSVPAAQGATKITGLLRSLSGMSAPCYIETAFRLFSQDQNYPIGGLIFADGVTVGSGSQIRFSYGHVENKVEYGVHTGYNAQASNANYALSVAQLGNWIYLRMHWSAANAFSLYASGDGVVWIKLADVTPTITPTHFGLMMGSFESTTYGYAGQYSYFRARAGAPANG